MKGRGTVGNLGQPSREKTQMRFDDLVVLEAGFNLTREQIPQLTADTVSFRHVILDSMAVMVSQQTMCTQRCSLLASGARSPHFQSQMLRVFPEGSIMMLSSSPDPDIKERLRRARKIAQRKELLENSNSSGIGQLNPQVRPWPAPDHVHTQDHIHRRDNVLETTRPKPYNPRTRRSQ
jgi:hypothetical protein